MTSRMARADRGGWAAVVMVTGLVALSWLPVLDASYGDNHEGRVFGRFALHVRNLHELGVLGSGYGSAWQPYGEAYAHHPPLATALSALFGALPGEGEWQVRAAPYLLGLLVIPAAAWLLRNVGIGWVPTLLTIGLLVGTALYWVYGRIVFDLGPAVLVAAACARLRTDPDPPRRARAAAVASAFVACLAGWLAIAFCAVLGLWLLAGRRLDTVTVRVGAAMVAGVTVSLVYVFGLAGGGELGDQALLRTTGSRLGVVDYLARQWQWLSDLFPIWSLVLLPLGILAGLARRSTRSLAALTTLVAVGWIVAIPNGSTMHDYWIYPLLIPFVLGTGVLLDAGWRGFDFRLPVAATTGLVLAALFAHMVLGDVGRQYVTAPLAAGHLVEDQPPPPAQQVAWTVRIGAPRWLAYYWDLPPRDVGRASARRVPAEDLVLVDLADLPRWISPRVARRPVARRGSYVLVTGARLRAAIVTP